MGRGEEQYVHAFVLQCLPGKGFQGVTAIAAQVRIDLVQLGRTAAFAFAGKKSGLFHLRMAQKDSSQFESGVASGPNDGGLDCRRHQARISSSRDCSSLAFLLSEAMISRVSSPATVPTISSQFSPSMATATDWALPATVLMTNRFCARRTSRTNSRTTRDAEGAGSAGASPLGQM